MKSDETKVQFMRDAIRSFLENAVHHYRSPDAEKNIGLILHYLREMGFPKSTQRRIQSLAKYSDAAVKRWNKSQKEAIAKANAILRLLD
jgi:uncharacterized protein YjgD (DUF1641 family)